MDFDQLQYAFFETISLYYYTPTKLKTIGRHCDFLEKPKKDRY